MPCERCDELFDDYDELEEHQEESYNHWICQQCDIDFWTENELNEHYHHSNEHNYCFVCERDFISPANISSVCSNPPTSKRLRR